MIAPRHSYELLQASRARFDGTSAHETRPGACPPPLEGASAIVVSTIYEPDGSTTITWADDLKVAVTGYGRRVRAGVVA